MARLPSWGRRAKRDNGLKSTLGNAARYLLKNRRALSASLLDATVPIDDNPAERQLRRVVLGRKNYLFVGDEECGANIGGIYSLVATCELNKGYPQRNLEDVLFRVSTPPAYVIDDLLPDRWRPPDVPAATCGADRRGLEPRIGLKAAARLQGVRGRTAT